MFPYPSPGSDSLFPISPFSVRRSNRFGLTLPDFSFSCPNMLWVRTRIPRFLLFLSEEVPGSDSLFPISPFSVRRSTKFGLTLPDFPFSCPNELQVRTRIPRFLLFLSEEAPSSDSLFPISPFPVRRSNRFGLTLPDFSFSCPNMLWVRTRIPRFLLFLSEYAPGSDSLFPISPFPVRICTKFGLALHDFSFSCPNKFRVRTHTSRFLLFLSEWAPGSDSQGSTGFS